MMHTRTKVIASLVAGLLCAGCGSSTGGSAAGSTGVAASGAQAQDAVALTGTISTAAQSAGTHVNTDESVRKAILKTMKGLVKSTTVPLTSAATTSNCQTSGTVTSSLTGSVTIDDAATQLTFNSVSAPISFSACKASETVTIASAQTCTFSTTMDGAAAVGLAGTATLSGSTLSAVDLTATVTTTSACSGLTVTVGGRDHTVGLSLSATLNSLTAELRFTGDICIDNTVVDASTAEASDFTAFSASDLSCGS